MNTFNDWRSAAKEESPRAEYFIRVGQNVYNEDKDTEDFVWLPQFIPLDTMRKNKVNGQGEYPELLAKGNDLLDALIEYAKHLEAGDSEEVQLTVRLYRSKPKEEQKYSKPKFEFGMQK